MLDSLFISPPIAGDFRETIPAGSLSDVSISSFLQAEKAKAGATLLGAGLFHALILDVRWISARLRTPGCSLGTLGGSRSLLLLACPIPTALH